MDKLEAVQEIMRLSIEINGVEEDRFAIGGKPCVTIYFAGHVNGLMVNVYYTGRSYDKKPDYVFDEYISDTDVAKLVKCVRYLEKLKDKVLEEAA
ncbi:hypothetical protein [Acetobacterium sp.]|uniref:hypothetical protein n=1 Tax=Acetobacterium sp. TaxID=1872094 RepID=UPI002728EF9C|nr:hypothetical protein [Acetobacterium sp.]MDO9492840.1 hypothetical protein [Acetobacterium sp.]